MTDIRKVDWGELAQDYIEDMENPYHRHRLRVLSSMIPERALRPGARILDFGCGDGCFLPPFLKAGARVWACDKEEKMIRAARERLDRQDLCLDENFLRCGGTELLAGFEPESLDGIIAFNVLAYLDPDEEAEFYTQACRIVKNGGFLLVSHSNELFDLFSLNSYTASFFIRHLLYDPTRAGRIPELLRRADHPSDEKAAPLAVRENPLNYGFKLAKHGFTEIRQEYMNWHEAPTPLLPGGDNACEGRTFPDTLDLPESERWKLLFTCSMFASLSTRR